MLSSTFFIFNLCYNSQFQIHYMRLGRVESKLFSKEMLYYIFNLHQTTTKNLLVLSQYMLYYIFNLHQTTTTIQCIYIFNCCIISLIYIKPQPDHFTSILLRGCIISLIYIKPQRCQGRGEESRCCIISLIYIKPQLKVPCGRCISCCIISLIYIKPQQSLRGVLPVVVVLYL